MNKIFKVIYSKVRNCYVVTSEFAKANTKSSTGLEKSRAGKKVLLTLAVASAIMCGGWMNVGATATVTDTATSTAKTVYETGEVDSKIDSVSSNVTANKDAIAKLDTNKANANTVYTKDQTYTKTEVDAELDKKANADTVYTKDQTYTKTEVDAELDKKANADTVYTKDQTYTKTEVDAALDKKANADNVYSKSDIDTKLSEASNSVDTKLADYAKTTDVNAALDKKANKDDVYSKTEADAKFATSDALDAAKKDLSDKITANTTKVDKNASDISDLKNKDTLLEGKIDNNTSAIGDLKDKDVALDAKIDNVKTALDNADTALGARIDAEAKAREDADKALGDRTTALEENTGGIKRNTEDTQTTIEGTVKVDNLGNIKDVKELGAETIKTSSDASIGGKLSVTGETSLKNTKVDGTLETTGKATFDNDVDVKGDLKVDGKLDVGEISMKNDKLNSDGKQHDSATTITADGISNNAKVTDKNGKVTESKFTHDETGSFNYAKEGDSSDWKETTSNVTANGVSNKMTDSDGNKHSYSQTASETKEQLTNGDKSNFEKKTAEGNTISIKDKDQNGNDKSFSNKQTVDGEKTSVTNKDGSSTINQGADKISNNVTSSDGKKSSTEMTADGITNTSKDGTIKNDAKDIVNKATNEITNEAGTKITDKVGDNTRVTDKNGIKDSVGTDTSREMTSGKITDTAGDSSVTTENGKGTTFTKTGSTAFSDAADAPTDTNISGNQLTTGRLDANELGVSDKDGNNTADLNVKAGDNGGVSASAGNGKTTGSLDVKADEVGSSVKDATGGTNGSDFRQRIDAIMGNVKSAEGESEIIQKGNQITSEVGKGESTNSKVTQTKDKIESVLTDGNNQNLTIDKADMSASAISNGNKMNQTVENVDATLNKVTDGTNTTEKLQTATDITNTAKNGTIKNDAKDIINNATGNMTNTVGGDLTTTVTGKTVEDYKGGLTTTVTGDESHTVTGNQTNTIKGNQTTTVTGDISNSAKNITNKASEKLTDKVGDNTRVLDKDGITDTVGNTSFKQRTDDIMMEAKNGTITSDAKNIVNKAAENISNEATNISNKATGTISNNASEIKNEADKLISNKVGENTYQNIEDGKITESIKNGTKQNLTQSDADGTNHSVVDGAKSSVTKQTFDEITGAVTNGSSSNVTQNTATSTNNTIADLDANGKPTKANSVISTVDGTAFVNSDAAAPVTGASGAGTADRTTIKGNTITTGKVTMDYADVMKDLGVRGNANIQGKTTTGELEVTGKSTLKGDVTMEGNAAVKKDLTVEGTTTTKDLKVTDNATIGGTLDVTGKATFNDSVDVAKDLSVGGNATIAGDVTANSYKVGGKTYIDANGINANNQVISNVADGTIAAGSTDAVNGGQLFETNHRIDQFDSRINEVGANAAAMANLHPMEFDADSKLNVAVGVGNYRNKTATAMGLFYRPNEDVMFNVSSTIGSSDNMIGGGVSFRLGSGGNKLKNRALSDAAEQNKQLKSQVDTLQSQMDALLSVINPNMSKDFPDVPDNHWAYEAVSRLAGNDIIQGYEDGKYHGERTMTRYEMAAIIYKALQKGAKAEAKLVEEFKPELKAMAAHEKA